MRKDLWLTALVVASCAEVQKPPPAPPPPPVAVWDSAAEHELRAELDKMSAAWAAGDLAEVREMVADDEALAIYDIDGNGHPRKYRSREYFFRTAREFMEQREASGKAAKAKTTTVSCQATATFGVCVQEFEVEIATPDGTSQTTSFRGTGTARKGPDGWKWTHWHASYASSLPPPPPPPPDPHTAHPRNADFKKLSWRSAGDDPNGVQTAVVWKHPITGAQAAFFKVPKKFSVGPHHHTANTWLTVIKGSLTVTTEDGQKQSLKAGGYRQTPGGMVHSTEAKRGATFFMLTDGPFDRVLKESADVSEAPAGSASDTEPGGDAAGPSGGAGAPDAKKPDKSGEPRSGKSDKADRAGEPDQAADADQAGEPQKPGKRRRDKSRKADKVGESDQAEE